MTETTVSADIAAVTEKLKAETGTLDAIEMEMSRSIVGQKEMIRNLLIGLLADGHILLEGVPGLAKTLAINTLAKVISAGFSRIQFTPDLLPSDLIGTVIYNMQEHEFSVKKGPVFANLVLADEINRAPAKVQSALLEAMQERQVTIGEQSFGLPKPFLVMATQNPVEQEGTYPLPEAQVDRFMLKTVISYPQREDERAIIRQNLSSDPIVPKAVIKPAKVLELRKLAEMVYMDEKIEQYVLDIVFATREPEDYGLKGLKELIYFGASPRGSINLAKAARVNALLNKRGYVVPDDVRTMCLSVLRHRIGLSYEAEAENVSTEEIVKRVLDKVEVP